MLSVYSFKNHFLESLLSNGAAMFPGAEKLLAVYYNNDSLGLIGKELDLNSDSPTLNPEVSTDKSIIKLRKQRPRSTWLKNFEIVASENTSKAQLNIHSEYDNHVLLIRFPNSSDGFSDLLFVFFRNEDQIFQFSGNPQKLSTSIKDAVANILVRSLDVIRNQLENDAAIFDLINKSDSVYDQQLNSLKYQLESKTKEQLNHYKSLAESVSDPFSKQTGHSITWTEESLLKLIKMQLPLKELKSVLKNALTIVVNRSIKPGAAIEINANDLITESHQELGADAPIISIRYERTYQLLDRYEEADKRVTQEKIPLTGVNLGKYCNPAVSPAAISDALKKHGKKIMTLFDQEPNRWSLLRNEFRPVKNIMYKTGLKAS
ncbi:MAG TPA: hypothetical protein ENL09_03275 [Bacteroidetes bacterium]|nr:hypothetical protein [Bacteroidota bacterium]